MPSFSVLSGFEGFYFQPPCSGLSTMNPPRALHRATLKDQTMKITRIVSLLIAGFFACANACAQYADTIISYIPGAGFTPGFTNASAALGEPSRITPGQFGGPVDPFNPPYLPGQLLSIGAGGSLTLKFSKPVLNHPRNRFGIDFIIFGNSGFVITNAFDFSTFDWIGTPSTDGSLFGNNAGMSRVSVSRDGITYYE